MIYNDNGILLERVCINNTIISFPSFYSFNESSNDKENEILQNIEAIKDEIKECDDNKLKKLEKKAKTTFIQNKIKDMISKVQVCLTGLTVLMGLPAALSVKTVVDSGFAFKTHKISTAITAIFASMMALIAILNPIKKRFSKSSDKNTDSIKKTLKEVLDLFNNTANNDKLPKDIRDDAKKKAIKVSDIILSISNNINNTNDNYYDTGKRINQYKVFVTDKDNYNLRKNEYDSVINIINSKWRLIINNALKYIKDRIDDINNINDKFLDLSEELTIRHSKNGYTMNFSFYFEYEENSDAIYIDLVMDNEDIKSKVINMTMDIEGVYSTVVI